MKDTLQGRSIGILIADGSDAVAINSVRKAVTEAGASVKMVGPKISEIKLSDGSSINIDGQLAGTPSVLFDAVAIVLSAEAAKILTKEAAAIDFVRDAFGHLKAIATDQGGMQMIKHSNLSKDSGVIDVLNVMAFIKAACTRQWDREKAVRTLV